MKTIYYVSGLPRSGSTLLMNVLNQNPRFYGTASSGILDIVRGTRDRWDKHPFFKAMPEPDRTEKKLSTIKGLLQGYFADVEEPICIDKNRGWPTIMEMLGRLYGKENVKVIACVRDMRDILASFEKLYRKTLETSATTQERAKFDEHRTALGRAMFIARPKEVVGYATRVLRDAVTRGWRDNIHYVDYDALTANPEGVLEGIYSFLGEEPHDHDFDKVECVTVEDDSVHGFTGLHKIRSKIAPQEPQWPLVFDRTVYDSEFWKHHTINAKFWLQG